MAPRQAGPAAHIFPDNLSGVLLRKCACGDSADAECAECRGKREEGVDPSASFEQEADHVADQIRRMPDAIVRTLQRVWTARKREETKLEPNRKLNDTGDRNRTIAPPVVETVLREPGQPLDAATRSFFEQRFRYDFSQVRIHADSRGAESADAVGARAYAAGPDIVFAAGCHDPASTAGRRLLAHELAHVVQQGCAPSMDNNGRNGTPSLECGFRNTAAESAESIKLSAGIFRGENTRIARDKSPSPISQSTGVGYVAIYFGTEDFIDFHTDKGLFRYHIDEHSNLAPGEYAADVAVKGNNVTFTLDVAVGGAI